MVTVRRRTIGSIVNADVYDSPDLRVLLSEDTSLCDTSIDKIEQAAQFAREIQNDAEKQGAFWASGLGCYAVGIDMLEILCELDADEEALLAALLYRSVREKHLTVTSVEKKFGRAVAKLIGSVQRMAVMSEVATSSNSEFAQDVVLGQQKPQLDNLRHMIVDMMDDVRVALIKLAERAAILSALKNNEPSRKQKVAREVMDVYAPLAHRLGVGHLKWELEDLAFRYLKPEAYKDIAEQLDEKRLARESYIEQVTSVLRKALDQDNVKANIYGRVKHIYSIWRKMQKKNLPFSEIYDIRAFRIMVEKVGDCYTVLGKVHELWEPIPGEFDDYIATPKPNGYRSLHTALIGPEGKIVEVQIRTEAMHQDAELGVCAHWRYKEGSAVSQTSAYEQKIEWLRQVLEWQDELGETNEHLTGELTNIRSDRIFVITPKGHVVDLANGATPIDFAYYVHTEVGHRCRGAKVNGKIVPLTYKLHTGDQVQIITSKEGDPSRDWLNQDLGYVNTPQARSKIRSWYRAQERDNNVAAGKILLDRELRRLNIRNISVESILDKTHAQTVDEFYANLGNGDFSIKSVVQLFQRALLDEDKLPEVVENGLDISKVFAKPSPMAQPSGITVQGQNQVMLSLATCCKPVAGDPILGFITQGRGVSIHHEECTNILHLNATNPERIVEVNWGVDDKVYYPVQIYIKANDGRGVLGDIISVLTHADVNVTATRSRSNRKDKTANFWITFEVQGIQQLSVIIAKLDAILNVIEVHRVNLSEK